MTRQSKSTADDAIALFAKPTQNSDEIEPDAIRYGIEYHPVRLVRDSGWKLETNGVHDDSRTVPYLYGLSIRAWVNDSIRYQRGTSSRPRFDFYCAGISYRPFRVDESEATAMAATFRRFNAAMDRMRNADGDWTSHGQYVLRVCKALGIATVVIENTPAHAAVSGQRYRVMNLPEAQGWLDSTVSGYLRKCYERRVPETESVLALAG